MEVLQLLFCIRESIRRVDNLAAYDRQQRRSSANFLNRYGYEILIENGEVGELAVFQCSSGPRVGSPPTVLPSSIHWSATNGL
jgi:hypothetical protein